MKFPILLVLILALGSCAGKDGDDGDSTTINVPAPETTPNPPQSEEEEPTGCLSAARRTNIQTFLNRVSSLDAVVAPAIYTSRNDDGSYTSYSANVRYDMAREGEDNWVMIAQLCDATVTECYDPVQTRLAILEDNCFYSDSTKTKVTYSSSSRLTYNWSPNQGVRVNESYGISSGKLNGKKSETLDRRLQYKVIFQQQ